MEGNCRVRLNLYRKKKNVSRLCWPSSSVCLSWNTEVLDDHCFFVCLIFSFNIYLSYKCCWISNHHHLSSLDMYDLYMWTCVCVCEREDLISQKSNSRLSVTLKATMAPPGDEIRKHTEPNLKTLRWTSWATHTQTDCNSFHWNWRASKYCET